MAQRKKKPGLESKGRNDKTEARDKTAWTAESMRHSEKDEGVCLRFATEIITEQWRPQRGQ